MLSQNPKDVAQAIKSLKIQGASKIRAAFVDAIKHEAKISKAKNSAEFRKEILAAIKLLLSSRPTEPEMRTAARIILQKLNSGEKNVEKLKKEIIAACDNYEKDRVAAMKKIAAYGAKLIKKNSVVFTHCHSHTVIDILKKAKKKIKYVIFTETRPLFQGHKTAKDLSDAKIPAIMIVDSAAATFMKNANIFITGCDAILADGSVVNKIGTYQISLVAKKFNVPHIVVGSSHKFSFAEQIEERSSKEVWNKKLPRIKIRNPAFDITPAENISKIVTELGIFSSQKFSSLMKRKLNYHSLD